MAEEGKRKKQISAEITNNKRWETPIEESLLSTVDKSDKSTLNEKLKEPKPKEPVPEPKPKEPASGLNLKETSEPKAKPEPKKPERIKR